MPEHVRIFPDPVLRKKTKPITVFNDMLAELFERMDQIMRSQPSGIGIAAPQVGVSRRLAIVDVSAREPKAKPLWLVNPKILEARDERASREGCMSLPDYTGQLKRYDWLCLQWQDMKGKFQEKVCEGIEAICVQHELDHLEGILFIDRVASLKRDLIPRPRQRQ